MKWSEPGPRVVRYITLRRLKTREQDLVGAVVAAAVSSDSKCDRSDGASETEHRDRGKVEDSSLLRNELNETNNWARLVVQLYFGWFALQFTVNGVAIGWLFTRTGAVPWFSNLVFLVFVGWNLMGTIGTVMVYKGLSEGDRRMKQVIEAISRIDQGDQHPWSRARSPMPHQPIKTVFGFCVVTMFISLGFWIIMFVTGGR